MKRPKKKRVKTDMLGNFLKIKFLCSVLLLAGCSQFPVIYKTSSPGSALDYYQWLISATQEELDQEMKSRNQAEYTDNSHIAIIQMAMLLSVPGTQEQEKQEMALKLIAQVLNASSDHSSGREGGDYLKFARVWEDVLLKRIRLQATVTDKEHDVLEKDSLVQQLESEKKKYIDQIEALKQIEQQVNDREQPRQSENGSSTR